MQRFLLPLFLFAFLVPAPAQVFLQMERSGTAATKKFSPGSELTYRLAGKKEWETAVLERILPEENRVLLGIQYLAPEDIGALRSYRPQSWSKPMATNLYVFGAGWTVFALGASLVDRDDPYSAGDAIVAGSAIITGFLIKSLFRQRTFRMGEKRRLRIIDLRVDIN